MNPLKSMKGLITDTPLEPVARKIYAFAKGVLRSAKCYPLVRKHLRDKSGLEVGGPSDVFETNLPIYRHIQSLDNCVFAEVTHWEGARAPGATFHFDQGRRTGNNFIAEGSTLECFTDASYDFVLSSHNLEHMANPIKALHNWKRVLKPSGFLLLVLPDKHRTFDYRRPVTTLGHMRDDYARDMGEDDMTHVEEFVTLWDYKKFPIASSIAEHRERYQNNYQQRLLHHHVFDLKSATDFVKDCNWQVLAAERARPNHLVLFLQKP
jgi:predicted SAM-dependent methyltransferase